MANRNSVNALLTATALSVFVSAPAAFAHTYIGLGVSIGGHVVRHAARHYYALRSDYEYSSSPSRQVDGDTGLVSTAAYVPRTAPTSSIAPQASDAENQLH